MKFRAVKLLSEAVHRWFGGSAARSAPPQSHDSFERFLREFDAQNRQAAGRKPTGRNGRL